MSRGLASRADLVSELRERVESNAAENAVVFVRDPGEARDSEALSYAELDRRARRTAVWLATHTEPGDRAVLVYPSGVEFAAAFFGCLYAGVIAVPAPLPGRYAHERKRLAGVIRDSGAGVVLSDLRSLEAVEKWAVEEGLSDVLCQATDTECAHPDEWRPHALPGPDAVALLQYTSGSTGAPKGVMVRHGNVRANISSLAQALNWTQTDRTGGWIPLYHDMGLIGLMLPGILVGGGYVQMDPMTFLRRPYQWLQMLDTFDVRATAAPDFGYDLCLRRVTDAQVSDLDLSRLRAACSGAEPIRAQTIARFAERFSAAGLAPEAVVPMYGLAESTLFVAGNGSGRPPSVIGMSASALDRGLLRRAAPGVPSRELVGCGSSVDLKVAIVDPGSAAVLPEGQVGEIWLSGPSVTAGYWKKAEATEATFEAVTAHGQGPFLRTGDLGGLLDGELFVTGRLKDVLVLHGRNLHPQDIEDELRAQFTELQGLSGAVFSLGEDESPELDEQVVVVLHEIRGQGTPEHRTEIAAAMKLTVAREFGVRVGAVLLLRPGGIRRTTSGKVERATMRSLYLAGTLEPLLVSEDPRVTAAVARRAIREAV